LDKNNEILKVSLEAKTTHKSHCLEISKITTEINEEILKLNMISNVAHDLKTVSLISI
jgi:hypothetical protein